MCLCLSLSMCVCRCVEDLKVQNEEEIRKKSLVFENCPGPKKIKLENQQNCVQF